MSYTESFQGSQFTAVNTVLSFSDCAIIWGDVLENLAFLQTLHLVPVPIQQCGAAIAELWSFSVEGPCSRSYWNIGLSLLNIETRVGLLTKWAGWQDRPLWAISPRTPSHSKTLNIKDENTTVLQKKMQNSIGYSLVSLSRGGPGPRVSWQLWQWLTC